MTGDDQEHSRVRTVLDDVADANDKRTAERLARRIPIDTDPHIENSGKPLRIRGMIEDGVEYMPGEHLSRKTRVAELLAVTAKSQGGVFASWLMKRSAGGNRFVDDRGKTMEPFPFRDPTDAERAELGALLIQWAERLMLDESCSSFIRDC